MKTCRACNIEQPKSNFSKQVTGKDGLRARCKSCTSVTDRAYHKKHAKKRRKMSRQWQLDNPKRYQKNKRRALEVRQRRIAEQTPPQSQLELSALEGLYMMAKILSNSCGESYHIDHIIPLSKGGPHHFDNLQILSAEDNIKKGNYLASL